jgi:hypothetical protein
MAIGCCESLTETKGHVQDKIELAAKHSKERDGNLGDWRSYTMPPFIQCSCIPTEQIAATHMTINVS